MIWPTTTKRPLSGASQMWLCVVHLKPNESPGAYGPPICSMAPTMRPGPLGWATAASNHLPQRPFPSLLCWGSLTQSVVSWALVESRLETPILYMKLTLYGMAGRQHGFTTATRCRGANRDRIPSFLFFTPSLLTSLSAGSSGIVTPPLILILLLFCFFHLSSFPTIEQKHNR